MSLWIVRAVYLVPRSGTILWNLGLIEGLGLMLRGSGEGLKLIIGTEGVRLERVGDGIGGK